MTPTPAESALPRQPSVDGRMCFQCGPDVLTDEDGCCNTCGADTALHMDVRRWFAADAHAIAESRAECERLRKALERVTDELQSLADTCDHSVGICWCDTLGKIESARTALSTAQQGEPR